MTLNLTLSAKIIFPIDFKFCLQTPYPPSSLSPCCTSIISGRWVPTKDLLHWAAWGKAHGLLITYFNLIVGPANLHGACMYHIPLKFLKNSGSRLDCSQRMVKNEKPPHTWITRTCGNSIPIITFVTPQFYIAGDRSPTPCTDLSGLLSQGPTGTGGWDGSRTSALGVFLDSSAQVSHPAVTKPLTEPSPELMSISTSMRLTDDLRKKIFCNSQSLIWIFMRSRSITLCKYYLKFIEQMSNDSPFPKLLFFFCKTCVAAWYWKLSCKPKKIHSKTESGKQICSNSGGGG